MARAADRRADAKSNRIYQKYTGTGGDVNGGAAATNVQPGRHEVGRRCAFSGAMD
jgi:hypothetical protein